MEIWARATRNYRADTIQNIHLMRIIIYLVVSAIVTNSLVFFHQFFLFSVSRVGLGPLQLASNLERQGTRNNRPTIQDL